MPDEISSGFEDQGAAIITEMKVDTGENDEPPVTWRSLWADFK